MLTWKNFQILNKNLDKTHLEILLYVNMQEIIIISIQEARLKHEPIKDDEQYKQLIDRYKRLDKDVEKAKDNVRRAMHGEHVEEEEEEEEI